MSAQDQGDHNCVASEMMTMKVKKNKQRKVRMAKKGKVREKTQKKNEHMVSLSIDGKPITVEKGTTVLEAAQKLNIDIPTLCYHKALSPYGACRLCVVEITKGKSKKIQTSCVYPCEEGLEIATDTLELREIRKTMIQLIMARAPNSEKVQEMARSLGVVDTPFVIRDEQCILCGLCVRMCRERMGQDVIGFKGRGDTREIAPPFDVESPRCMVCGACYTICPTAAARLKKMGTKTPRPLLDEFDERLRSRPAIRIPFPQAVPNAAIIDREHCVHFATDKCMICQDMCEAKAIDFNQQEEKIALPVGSVILASGAEAYEGTMRREYGYGRFPNVVTSLEFERILSASGPFHGHIQRPSDGQAPKRIAFIQCVGSREDDYTYCSSVCCMYATKEALIAMEHSPGLDCTIFFMDLRAFGKGFDEYYEKAKKNGVHYIRCRPSSVDEDIETKDLLLKYFEEDGKVQMNTFDMVVLACGLHPSADLQHYARILGIELNKAHFCKTDPLAPTASTREGIYVCGPCSEPKDIPETVTQSSAAAAQAMELLASERHSLITQKEYPPEIDVSKQEPRIGVFICQCGINIGAYVDVSEVVKYTKNLPSVVYAEDNLYTCSQDSQRRIIEMIGTHKLNRVVVASCTPRTHEALFRETIREAGLNPYLFEMANIRDQCSWIHMSEPEEATAKAKDLVRMAVAKAQGLSPLKRVEIDVTQKALVIGGGLAGMMASLSLADQGYQVFLVEKTNALGGHARHIYYTLENGDVPAFLGNLEHRIREHPMIEVCTDAYVKEVNGFIGNYKTVVACAGKKEKTYTHGVIIVATGAQEYQPTEYLYGKDERVITQQELEQLIHMNGHGLFNLEELSSVVMIQCVGSRESDHMYCSRRCCSQAIKNALKLHEINPKLRIFVMYRDIRTYGFKEEFYTKARESGVMFVRYDPEHKPVLTNGSDKLSVSFYDPVLGESVEVHPSMVVLSTGIVPNANNGHIAKMLKVPLNSDGYFLEAHVKLRPVDFATEGIFVAGLAHGPKFMSETISQARAAAARAATILAQDKYYAEATVSQVNEDLCVGCGICSNLCPYEAISMVTENGQRRSKVNEALCKGCGTCVAACPSGAMDQCGFTKHQIMAMIEAMK
jgi:heterodisulfide reductase subunit A